MKRILSLIFIFILSLEFSFSSKVFAQPDGDLYPIAQKAAAAGDKDYAFMCFHAMLHNPANAKYYKQALFSTGEYYYFIGDYRSAAESFTKFINIYSKDEAFPFAIVYLLKISDQMLVSQTTDDLRKKVISFKQLSLLFSEFKELLYTSALNLHYKAVYFIDRVEIYINGELFEKIYF